MTHAGGRPTKYTVGMTYTFKPMHQNAGDMSQFEYYNDHTEALIADDLSKVNDVVTIRMIEAK